MKLICRPTKNFGVLNTKSDPLQISHHTISKCLRTLNSLQSKIKMTYQHCARYLQTETEYRRYSYKWLHDTAPFIRHQT